MDNPKDNTNDTDSGYELDRHGSYKKRTRTIMTPTQNELLMRFFMIDPFPPTEIREDLARNLRIKPRTVQIWFQNQRQKAKQRGEDMSGIEPWSQQQFIDYSIPNTQYKKSRLDILADIAYEEYCKINLNKQNENDSLEYQ
ncbi:zinc finger domain-containing protein [Tubulinosema ratisbonensis]|uniref:Zinc finger domain-containing protein n=1 Tax=Tubulinosema ratisbonensis TaxID=291195 RepID=A0A437ALP2_9MICR|nr:zinc finger domain-containing protein [Tubulinosema ratisbonensis]